VTDALANPFTLLEYDPIKLLNSPEKVASIFEVRDGKRDFDPLFPISIELHLTDRCNLKCPWCTDAEVRKRDNAELGLKELERLFADLSRQNVGITMEGGGEPTVHPRFAEVVEMARSFHLPLGLITNGIVRLGELARAFLWIRVSVDSASRDEFLLEKGADGFNRVLSNLKALAEMPGRPFLLGVGYVMTNRNVSSLLPFLRSLDELGVDYFYGRPVEESPPLLPDLTALYELKAAWETDEASRRRIKVMLNLEDRVQKDNEGLPCLGHSLSCIVRANGDILMCEKRRHDPVTFGNLRERRFSEIWTSDHRIRTSRKLMCPENQIGCEVCRITRLNRFFSNLAKLKTRNFI
jgi:radical SAM protein with 4Fe4S-binding SPASM domain